MEGVLSGGLGGFWMFALPLLTKTGRSTLNEQGHSGMNLLTLGVICVFILLLFWVGPGGAAWALYRGRKPIPGPRGYPVVGSLMELGCHAHRKLARLATEYGAESLMALSLGSTRLVVASSPESAREILQSTAFSDRPIKQSAQQLLFARAIGFAPHGEYWRRLRRIAANHLFSPKRIAAHGAARQQECQIMVDALHRLSSMSPDGSVTLRTHLQHAALNNIMGSVFGRRYDFHSKEGKQLKEMVREGFDLLGAFNWADHLPLLEPLDPNNILSRCGELVPKVVAFVQNVIDEHRHNRIMPLECDAEMDFVDVLLGMEGEDKLTDADMIAVLWEMIFRGTDTTAILTEWILAELVIHSEIQSKLRRELREVVGVAKAVTEVHIARSPLLQAVVKETLRLHPPGPLLSWARLSTRDVQVAGHLVPAGTTAMVNMWAITHDEKIWENPLEFRPQRFIAAEGGVEFDVKGSDLRLAPFGAGRRVCPGRALGMATVQMWVAKLVLEFDWSSLPKSPVCLEEVLKLSSEMRQPLSVSLRKL
ncbi:hypothetical protein R1sor_006891 [Riccia sorocarpa]|uniref:Cytochrome P450 n=1 Tax=Riccia sorocarpa TaxID=122646 RepID=A0ABD3HNW2_9MARC